MRENMSDPSRSSPGCSRGQIHGSGILPENEELPGKHLAGPGTGYSTRKRNLSESLAYLESIIRNSPDPFLTTDLEGRVQKFNRSAEKLTGYSADEIYRSDISLLMGEGLDMKFFREVTMDVPLHGLETTILTKEGRSVQVRISASELAGEDGVPIGMFFIVQDFTEQKVLQDGLLDTNARLEEAIWELREKDRLKSDFIMLLRHEINTPLSVILSMLSLWEIKNMFTPEQREKIPTLEKQLRRLEALTDRMLDVDHLEIGLIDYINSEFEAGELIDDIVEALAVSIERKNHTIIREPREKAWLVADRVRLEQSLIVLVDNAINYTAKGGTIQFGSERRGEEVVFIVKDKGRGIPRTEFKKIFMRFYQISDIQHHKDGFGLGLSIAKRIVEQQGGRIWLESEVGKGSTFYVAMPALDSPGTVKEGCVETNPDRKTGA